MKIRPVRTELLHADRRTDGRMDWPTGTTKFFSQFCEHA